MVEEFERLVFAIAGVAQARRGTHPAKIAAAEDNSVEVLLGHHVFALHAPLVGRTSGQ